MKDVVLLVDDDLNLLHALARTLRHQPYELYTATSAEEALLLLKGHEVDVIVSDEQMPGMCGSDLLAWAAESYPDVPRIVLTGRATVETAIRAINEGSVYQFFTKPCNPAHLGVAIRKALEHRALLKENRALRDVNGRQMQELDDYKRDLEILSTLISRDIRQPLQTTMSRSCELIGKQHQGVVDGILDGEARASFESVLERVADAQRLAGSLLKDRDVNAHVTIPSSPTSEQRTADSLANAPPCSSNDERLC
ncbi:MAG: response regulator [Pirellulaceae bacterium]